MGTLEKGWDVIDQQSWPVRWRTIINRIRVIHSTGEEQKLLEELSACEEPVVVGFVNAHAMNSLTSNDDFFGALSQAAILLRDGSGMSLLYRSCHLAPGLNMNGTDLIPKIIATFRSRRVSLWGTEEPFLSKAAARCSTDFGVELVSTHHGFDSTEAYCSLAIETKPELVVLGMGMPKQELIAQSLCQLRAPVVIVCGGAILDFLGGKVSRAPAWARNFGIEWIYRLMLEPRRLFRRYVLGNPSFILRLFRYRQRGMPDKGARSR